LENGDSKDLLSNALKFTPDGRKITVVLAEKDEAVFLP